jgi:hypothetical protein
MIAETHVSAEICANEACTRAAEAGEAYCSTCGLERSLYRRDDRRPGGPTGPLGTPEPRR